MITPKIIDPDLVMLKARQRSLKKHYEKLSEIKKTDPKLFPSKTSSNFKPKSPLPSERKQEISRTNQLLLQKITTISHRKLDLQPGQKPGKSLNKQFRIEKAQKINQENELLAQRLRSQKSQIPKTQLDKDFEAHQRYKDQLSKKRLLKFQETFKVKSPIHEKSKFPNFDPNNQSRPSKTSTQRYISATPLPPPAAYKNPAEFSFTLLSDSSYSEDFD